MSSSPRFWLIVSSRDHILRGVEGGFCQANHGKKAPLQRMKKGDGVLTYSPKVKYGETAPCQKFTAIGRVKEDKVFQVKMTENFEPWRRNVEYEEEVEEVDIRPLIEELGFIKNKEKWGASFRFGFIKVPKEDWERVERVMLKKND